MTGNIHKATRLAFKNGKRVVIHKGGTGSGKTFDLMIFLALYIASRQENKIITVVSESRPHLEIGAIRILKNILKSAGIFESWRYNETKGAYQFEKGSVIEFFSADRIDKALGARRDWLFGNEINSLKLEVWDELARRSENVIGDFNPTAQFWLEDWLLNYDDTEVIKSNHTWNIHLPDIERQRILKRAARDANFKRIHIDCEYGVYEGLVFDSWMQTDTIPEGGKVKFGMDFGYTNDPSALMKVVEFGDAYYVEEIFYQTGMLNRDIVSKMKQAGLRPSYDEIIADSAEPKSIDEIRLAGFNVKPSVKGKDSIITGIDKLKSKKLYITKNSVNLIRELRNYAWVVDKDGKPTNKPIDQFNHGIDAVRYAISTNVVNNWVA
jgi:phage terminase large subunit